MPRSIPKDRFHDLVEAATSVFLEQGFRRTQMADVAARMGVAKGTVYLYVESKEALFDAVVRHADRGERLALPAQLPVATPLPGATLEEVRKRVAATGLPVLTEALARRRVVDVRTELEAVVRELYGLLARHRVGIKLLDRCAHDHPELAAVWYGTGREAVQDLLRRYLEDRIRRRRPQLRRPAGSTYVTPPDAFRPPRSGERHFEQEPRPGLGVFSSRVGSPSGGPESVRSPNPG